eukprot:GHVL01037275.1.p1 GENE.GHVL01037275.1~~GHVL01037275.1.p1  ORF type:complete len:131 (+),score=29.95 GHVL01037275.1:62-454(+)
MSDLEEDIFTSLSQIKDPEFPHTLGQLLVVTEDSVNVDEYKGIINIKIQPTIPSCHLAPIIALSIRHKIDGDFGHLRRLSDGRRFKTDLAVIGHDEHVELTKQINDKERVAAAMHNEAIIKLVLECTQDE